MNELIEALRDRITEIREQVIYNRFLEKKAKEMIKGVEEKIMDLEMKADAQKHISEYAIKSLEKIQKKHIDMQIGELEKRIGTFEENQEKKSEHIKSVHAKLVNDIRAINHAFDREKTALNRRIAEFDRKVYLCRYRYDHAGKKQKELKKEISKINSRLKAVETRMRKIAVDRKAR